MAHSMHGVSPGIHDKNESRKLGAQADDKATSELRTHANVAQTQPGSAPSTGLAAHELPTSKKRAHQKTCPARIQNLRQPLLD